MLNNIATVLEALPYQAAILNFDGIIVAVNEAWRTFADNNGANSTLRTGVGLNYLRICQQARGEDAHSALAAARSIESIMSGARRRATFRYDWCSQDALRHFECTTSAVDLDSTHRHVVVAHVETPVLHLDAPLFRAEHIDVAREGHDPEYLTAENASLRATTIKLRRQVLLYQHLESVAHTGGWECDLPRWSFQWTPETYSIHHLSTQFVPTFESIGLFYGSKDRDRLTTAFLQAAHFGAPFDLELTLRTTPKRRVPIRITCKADFRGIKPVRLYGVYQADAASLSRGTTRD